MIILIAVGVLGAAVSLLTVVDPVETKMADDNDPFGPPGQTWVWLSVLTVFELMTIGGLRVELGRSVNVRSARTGA